MATKFGYETIGTAGWDFFQNRITGSLFTCDDKARTIKISAYVLNSSNFFDGKARAAIYLHSNSKLIRYSGEVTIPQGNIPAWFNFFLTGSLLSKTKYVLVVWGPTPSLGNLRIAYDGGDTNQGHTDLETYNSFPTEALFSHNNNKHSIFCTYTPIPVIFPIGTQIRKKLGRSSEYGQRLYGNFEYGEQDDKFGIYQIRSRYDGQVIVKENFYWPANPQTETQQAHRQKLTDAVAGWQGLTDNQKEIYNERARYKPYSGYNLYIGEYILSH